MSSYLETLHSKLRPQPVTSPVVLDLFAGCGGMALGFEAQGFATIGFEKNPDACATYAHNLHGPCIPIELTTDTPYPPADVIIGGPPCQPFSVGGHQNGLADSRDGFPIFISAVERVRPRLWLFENVRGLLYRNKWYLDEIITQLESLGYHVTLHLLNAVDYGVPQNRERLIVVGHKGSFHWPKPEGQRITAGEALGELATLSPTESKFLTASMDDYVARYEKASFCKTPRDLHLDRPARTLTCRNIAAPTGDMMRLKLPDGRRRRLSIREAARLQSFPDWFVFQGSETSCFYQIGNAVPPVLAYHLAGAVRNYLQTNSENEAITVNRYSQSARQLSLFTHEMIHAQ